MDSITWKCFRRKFKSIRKTSSKLQEGRPVNKELTNTYLRMQPIQFIGRHSESRTVSVTRPCLVGVDGGNELEGVGLLWSRERQWFRRMRPVMVDSRQRAVVCFWLNDWSILVSRKVAFVISLDICYLVVSNRLHYFYLLTKLIHIHITDWVKLDTVLIFLQE